jgi:hypothetical protein
MSSDSRKDAKPQRKEENHEVTKTQKKNKNVKLAFDRNRHSERAGSLHEGERRICLAE